ncbi:OmpA family protein [Aidingimonas lacisalsi]|uniref:OmpA family protein n=1 Tax=Aidingimonas lacisalsi TaxID=2604086 RepID=UPI0011D1D95E|nr:OmpA family protein [Aidingimonas lacisalsi]
MHDERRHVAMDDTLLGPPEEESSGGWMVSYIDIMTLLVALFVLLLSLSSHVDGDGGASEPRLDARVLRASMLAEAASVAPLHVDRLGVPLPADAVRAMASPPAARPTPPSAQAVAPEAIVIALGVARPTMSENPVVIPPKVVAPVDLATPEIDDDVVVVVTEIAPDNTRELDPNVVDLVAQLSDAPRLPSLNGVEVSRVEEGISLRVEDHLLFESGSGELIDSGEGLVDELLTIIERYDGDVSIEGHTDSRPISTPEFPSNWELSSARAMAILRYLESAGVEPSRLRAVGFGETRPLASNDTADGRAQNRRVEVIVHL